MGSKKERKKTDNPRYAFRLGLDAEHSFFFGRATRARAKHNDTGLHANGALHHRAHHPV